MSAIKSPSNPVPDDLPKLDPKSREATQRDEAKEAMQRSFEHGAPEAGAADDFDDK